MINKLKVANGIDLGTRLILIYKNKKLNMRYIYALLDPSTNQIKYVGQTNDIDRRFNDHLSSSLNKNSESYDTYKARWIRKLLSLDIKPIIKIIEECENLEQSNLKEKYHIERLTNDGCKLTNSYVNDVTEFSLVTREKMSNAKKGKKLEEIVGEEKAIELKKYYSERTKLNNPNKTNDPLVREKISNTLKEYFSDKENHWAYGLKMDDDHNEKLRQAKLNNPKNVGNRKPRTEEQKEKIRNSIKGIKIKRSEILQYDLNMKLIRQWKSLRDIERSDNTFSRSQIAKCCKGNKETYAGFIWKYND
jgi:hypothetical protein